MRLAWYSRGSRAGAEWTPAEQFGVSDDGFFWDPTRVNSLYQNTAATSPVAVASDPVAYATDLSGKGNHGTQASGTSLLTWQTSGGYAHLDADSATDRLDVGPMFYAAGAATFVFAVRAAAQAARRIFVEYNTSLTQPFYFVGTGSVDTSKARVFIRNDASTTLLNVESTVTVYDGAWHVLTITDSGSAVAIRVDGADAGGGSYTRSGTLTLNAAGGAGAPASGFIGDAGAFLGITRVMTSDEIAAAEAYMAEQYGVTLASPLVSPFDFDAMLIAAPGTDTGTSAGAAPTYLYTTADEPNWDGNNRSKLLFDKAGGASGYIYQGATNTTNAQSVRDWLTTFAAVDDGWGVGIMRLNAGTVYGDGTINNFYAARNWAVAMYAWAYLMTRESSVYSDADHTAIKAMHAGWIEDLRWYYDPATDTAGAKLNNHLGWALLAWALCALVCNDHVALGEVQTHRQTLRTRSMADTFVKEDSVSRPMWGYDPDPSNPLPERAMSMLDLDRAVSTTLHNGFYYHAWHTACSAVIDLILDANGYSELTRTDGNFDWTSAVAAYDAICADDGAALWAFIAANDVDNTATLASHLNVSGYKVNADLAGLRLLTAKGFTSATIDTNLASKSNRLFGGEIDLIREFMV